MERIGIIGIGQMGMPMAKNLLQAGFALTVFSRRKEAADPLIESGATFADHPSDVIEKSDIVFLALPAPRDVKDVVFGKAGLASAFNVRNKIIVDTSTIDPSSSREMARRLKGLGVNYLDSPVSGGPEGAAKGTLTFMVGGDKQTFEKCEGVLKTVGKNIFYLGRSGSGTGAKLVNQLLVASNTLASAEAMQLSLALGLDSKQIIEVIKTSAGDSFVFRRVAPKMAESSFGPGWQTYLLTKDLRLLEETLEQLGLPSMTVKTSLEVFSKSLEQGLGDIDSASVINVLDKMKGKIQPS
jgi:3-hydroxyisobutyrate dehydrogenase